MGCCSSRFRSRDTFYPLVYEPWSRDAVNAELPSPGLPSCRKSDIFRREDYTAVEKHIQKPLPRSILYGSFQTVAKYLTRKAKDDIGRLWAIYIWVTNVKKANLSRGQEPEKDSLLDYVQHLEESKNLHAHLFAALTNALDIQCVILTGVTKNAAYILGEDVHRSNSSSQWNAVCVDQEWRLVDTFWGSQSVIRKRSEEWAIVDAAGDIISIEEKPTLGEPEWKLNGFFFLTDPDMLICTHLPDQPEWQLLPEPVSRSNFTSTVYLRERYFQMNCSMKPQGFQGMLQTENGKLTIELDLPRKRCRSYDFKYLLFKDTMTCLGRPNQELQGSVFPELKLGLLSYKLEFPVSGRFRLDIFGADINTDNQNSFDLISSYLIECDVPSPDFEPLPDCPAIGWGPGLEAARVGLIPISHRSSTIMAVDGLCQIEFETKQEMAWGVELKRNGKESWELESNVLLYTNYERLKIDLRLPEPGKYAVKIFAKRSDKRGDQPGKMENVCNYLVKSEDDIKGPKAFPFIFNSTLGRRHYTCSHYGVQVTTFEDKIITEDKEMHFTFIRKHDGDLFGLVSGPGVKEDYIGNVLTKSTDGDKTVFTLTMEIPGEYSLNVFATDYDKNLMHIIQAYMITVNRNSHPDLPLCEPVCEVEPLYFKTMDMTINHPTTKHQLVWISGEKSLFVNQPGGQLDTAISTVKKDNALKVIVGVSALQEETQYRVGMFEETDEQSGCLKFSKDYRLLYNDGNVDYGKTTERDFSPEAMRARLKMVLMTKNYYFAQAALQRCRNNRYSDDDLLPRVEKMARIGNAQEDYSKAIRTSMKTGRTGPLERILDTIEREGLMQEMGFQVLVGRLVLVAKLTDKIRKMDQRTVAEVKSYHAPPRTALQVMKASLLLMGHKEHEIKEWEQMRVLINDSQKIRQKLNKATKVEEIDMAAAIQASELIADLSHEDAKRVSDVVDCFYLWSKNMIKLKMTQVPSNRSPSPQATASGRQSAMSATASSADRRQSVTSTLVPSGEEAPMATPSM